VRAVVSRVTEASVVVQDEVVGRISEPGLLVLLGVTHTDDLAAATRMARKIHQLRILRGEESLAGIGAPALVVSQFTLYGETSKGRRPSWSAAAPGAVAEGLVSATVSELRQLGCRVETGRFAADMAVTSTNDGPFTVIIDI